MLLLMMLFPLAGSILNGLILRPRSARRSGVIGTFAAGAAFLCALTLSIQLWSTETPISFAYPWMAAGDLQIPWGFRFDALTCVMALVVTGIGTLIHLYSIGYMSEENTPSRYFAYLNLFLCSMLVLISSDSLPVMFVGWEGVGLCSYLLIGYWYQDVDKAKAGMKAFIVNRIGDAGFLIGIFLCYQLFHTLSFGAMKEFLATAEGLDLHLINLAAFFLFIGAMGKSAQIPLYVWLPDAMAGPTPVSALIHAATMVTAGIYLICRTSFLFQLTADTNAVIAIVGSMTALMSALIATSQTDIKKVLAYSTVSQLGLMFVALGCGAYFAGIFHVVTHAFFKALLFLGAGSVIHAMSGEQDIQKMGGLRAKLPITFWTFAIATIAIAGLPPFAGFFSKDTILHSVLISPNNGTFHWICATLTSTLTAFYMARLFALTFLGKARWDHSVHPHESPITMTIPLAVLAVGSMFVGFLGVPHGLHFMPNYLEHFLSSVIVASPEGHSFLSEHTTMAIATCLALMGVTIGLWFNVVPERVNPVRTVLKPLIVIFENKFWVDELYGILFVRPFQMISRFLARIVDPKLIDGAVLFPAWVSRSSGEALSQLQYGSVQFYLLIMLIGGLALLAASLRGSMTW